MKQPYAASSKLCCVHLCCFMNYIPVGNVNIKELTQCISWPDVINRALSVLYLNLGLF